MVAVEVSVESVEGACAAERAGAARVELCSGASEGGLTASPGAQQRARERCRLELVSLIRPRGGDFLYTDEERAVMRADVLAAREVGLDGVALGCLDESGDVDLRALAELVDLARPLTLTFHRAFDLVRDPRAALEVLIDLGIDRVLTSGRERTALEGLAGLRALVELARDRIEVVAAGGVREGNARAIAAGAGVRSVHLAPRLRVESSLRHRNTRPRLASSDAAEPYARWETDESAVRAVVRELA